MKYHLCIGTSTSSTTDASHPARVAVLVFLLMRVTLAISSRCALRRDASSIGSWWRKNGLDLASTAVVGAIWGLDVGLVRLDFGLSMWSGAPIRQEIAIRLQLSLQLASWRPWWPSAGDSPGTLAALRQDTWIDYAIRIFSIAAWPRPRSGLGF